MAEKRSSGEKSLARAAGLDGLQALIERAGKKKRGPAPVEKWEPAHSLELDMTIKADGSWYHEGAPIRRQALVDLFATVLRKDADGYTYLVTPVERARITVEDAHFLAVEMNANDHGHKKVLTFRTNVGDVVEAGPENPLRFEISKADFGVKPYLLVRGRLEALLTRSVMHELMTHGEEVTAEETGRAVFALRSNGAVFPVMPMDELEKLSAIQ